MTGDERLFYSLTKTERILIHWFVNDYPRAKDLSEKMSISPETVKRHLSNIFDKTGMDSSVELAIFILRKPELEKLLREEVEHAQSLCEIPRTFRPFDSCGS